jgi:hypothetical protein
VPVNVLYCEGGSKSPDIRVLANLLSGIYVVKPAGSKYGFGQLILRAREVAPSSVVIAGLRDRDLEVDAHDPAGAPRPWRIEGGARWLGWYWERVEIENYLVDPDVVRRTLLNRAPEAGAYGTKLASAAESVAYYAAARTALTHSRLRFSPLVNCWGVERGHDKHCFPDQRGQADCRSQIGEIVNAHGRAQEVKVEDVLQRFDQLVPACHPGGQRFQHFLTFFAGKDLLFALEEALRAFGLGTPFEFRERVLKGLEESEDPWTWLPEWAQLREQASRITSGTGA